MADTKISALPAATAVAAADVIPIVQGGVNKKATVSLLNVLGGATSVAGSTGVAIGPGASTSGINRGVAIGYNTIAASYGLALTGGFSSSQANNAGSLAIHGDANGDLSSAIGFNSAAQRAQTAGSGAMALGGSYASGTDSFAAGIGDNTSTYGAKGANSVAIGYRCNATAANSLAIGSSANALASNAVALKSAYVSGTYCIGIDHGGLATQTIAGSSNVAIGGGVETTSDATQSVVLGSYSKSASHGKLAYASGRFSAVGDAQTAITTLRVATSDAVATKMSTNGSGAGALNQVVLPNNSAYRFTVEIVAKQTGSTNCAGYTITGVIVRGANAAATTLKASSKTVDWEDNTSWDVSASADTTNGALSISVTGAAGTIIAWVANVRTTEVTYA